MFGYKEWPRTYDVDHETYANVCQSVFNSLHEKQMYWDVVEDGQQKPDIGTVLVCLGEHNGIMFKGVELILRPRG